MNKLLIPLIFTLTCTPYIVGMENNALQFPENFDKTFKKITKQQDEFRVITKNKPFIKNITDTSFSTMVLLELSHNVHNYILESQPELAREIIHSVNRVNKNLYDKLNDPITTCDIIANIANKCNMTETHIARFLGTLGAQKCIDLSEQLYHEDLDRNKIEQLYKDGALLNYHRPEENTVLCYWTAQNAPKNIKIKSLEIMRVFLYFGANPNHRDGYEGEPPLNIAIKQQNAEKIRLLLTYRAEKPWNLILKQNQTFIDYCIADSTHDELNAGLITCVENNYRKDITQKFIDLKANPSLALPYVLKNIKNIFDFSISDSDNPTHIAIDNFLSLCKAGAFDTTTLQELKDAHKLLSLFIGSLEANINKEQISYTNFALY